ncbi:hypothetical protein JTE90_016850 [Oedothorax gibbosus]|uniref:BZIP domain-containing protein n=1 Tax=Oedothorax gibbosus TaxID=931172 RepID=A0AAV6VXI9_9ARAC|nr:hypothetical protein JTE90_016850 [Oedothorax gibbosus]
MYITCPNNATVPDCIISDMDLIEILWKQDIDLGVSREAYDSRQSVEVEKLIEIEKLVKKEKDIYNDLEIPKEEPSQVPELPSGHNYTIDSETGEYVFDEFESINENDIFNDQLHKNDSKFLVNNMPNENDTLLSEDSYLPFDSDVLDDFCDLSEVFSPNQLSHILSDDISSESDYLSQIENLGNQLEDFENLDGIDSTTGDGIYPNIEDCWPDATTMLPLLALGNNQAPLAPLSPHSINSYTNLNGNNNLPSPSRSNERYIGLLQNVSMDVPSTEEDFQPTSISSTIGPSSIGCAVAESMATLTNDTDPLPTSSIINTAYNSDFPDLMYSNHTVAVPHNELLISDLLLEEDLHFVSLTSNVNEEKHNEDHMDTSSDSVSLTSGQLPSVSDYESESRNFSDTPFQQVNCSDNQFYPLKNYYSDSSENCTSGKLSFSKKFDYSIPKHSSMSGSNLMHHNHSYHLPFNADEPNYKPAIKDKLKYSLDEDACNKDEKRAKELKLPISICDIINLAIDEYNERLSKYELTDAQLTLIRDIRRRGKNKVAAQNCRKRKMDQISSLQQDLGFLQREKMQLKSKQNHLLHEKLRFEDKYAQLYDLVLQTSNSKPPNPPGSIPMLRNNRMTLQTNSESFVEDDSDVNRGVRTRRKFKK